MKKTRSLASTWSNFSNTLIQLFEFLFFILFSINDDFVDWAHHTFTINFNNSFRISIRVFSAKNIKRKSKKKKWKNNAYLECYKKRILVFHNKLIVIMCFDFVLYTHLFRWSAQRKLISFGKTQTNSTLCTSSQVIRSTQTNSIARK